MSLRQQQKKSKRYCATISQRKNAEVLIDCGTPAYVFNYSKQLYICCYLNIILYRDATS
jgi:hypothetical protein